MKTLLLTSGDVSRIIQRVGLDELMDRMIDGIRTACLEYHTAVYTVPSRDGFAYCDSHTGLLEWMPAMKTGENVVIKMVGYHPDNPSAHKLPTILSTVLCFDTLTGHLLGVADGNFVTALRTGAASAIASRCLAKPDSRVLGLIGAGAQSVTQLHALSRVLPIDTVLIHDVDPAAERSFAGRTGRLGLSHCKIETAPLAAILANADILCTATSVSVGRGPLFADTRLQPHIHINAVGSDFPGKTELPVSLLRRSLVCPDFADQARREGECQQLEPGQIGPDLATLVRNSAQYEHHRLLPTVFDSTGWALEDYVAMQLMTELGRKLGCGQLIELESLSPDPKDPYGFALHATLDATEEATDHTLSNTPTETAHITRLTRRS